MILDWLRVEYEIEKPTLKLQSPIDLDSDGFVAEVKKVRGKKKPLTAAGLKALRDEYARSLEPARKLAAEAVKLEHEISDLVNAAYGLTPDEIALHVGHRPAAHADLRGPDAAKAINIDAGVSDGRPCSPNESVAGRVRIGDSSTWEDADLGTSPWYLRS